MSHIIVTGSTTGISPQAPVSQLPTRLEWSDFVQSAEFLTLYVRALQQFQAETQSDIPSYFQICGIHGLPPTAWDNDPNAKPPNGYCNHGINTFPTWHRPYVALYEQRLVSFFPNIVASFTDAATKQRLGNASQIWRLPYWDWAINQSVPPELANATVNILGTNGSTQGVANPFYRYTFHPIDSSFRPFTNPNYAAWHTTLRQPTSSRSANAVSQPDVVNEQLSQEDFKQSILDLFPTTLFQPDPWGQFSNHTWNSIHPNQGTLTSLESIHDSVHVDVGGAGHMGDPAVAAFDPIFWLHHCQVDRLLALWQAAYPTTYVSEGPDAAQDGRDVNASTPLDPFWKTQSTLATSLDCRSTAAYGYTYPEIASAGPVSPDQLSQIIHDTIDQLYGDGSVFSSFRVNATQRSNVAVQALTKSFAKTSVTPVAVHGNELHIPKQAKFALPKKPTLHGSMLPAPSNPGHSPPAASGPPATTTPPTHPDDYVVTPDTYRDWVANVTIEKYALGGPGRVCFFIGPESSIPDAPEDWHRSTTYVGCFTIFATSPPAHAGCANCSHQAATGARIGGTVHLTKTLIRHHVPLTGDEPVEYLTENLHWRVCTIQGNEVPRESIPSLKVVIQSAGYETGGEVGRRPERSGWTRHSPITRGKPGGVNHGDEF